MATRGAVPHSTSTEDFEQYLPTAPLHSSRALGWHHLTVRSYQEPARLDEMAFPGGRDIHLVMITAGQVYVEERKIGGPWIAHTLRTGHWFLSPAAGEPYALRWRTLGPAALTTLHIHLSADLFARLVGEVAERDPSVHGLLPERTGFQDPLLAHIGHSLQKEVQDPAAAAIGHLYADTAARMLGVHLLHHYATRPAPPRAVTATLAPRDLRRVIDYIHAHLHERLSLEVLAQQVGFSPYHFARLFRATTGESPHQQVLHYRLEAAQHLLRNTDLPLGQVAVAVGIPQQSHFTHVFKRYVGMTPLQYRRQH